jgi:hypothetical protein
VPRAQAVEERTDPLLAPLMAAAVVLTVGLMWDVSWDMSFGRDSFWSPPHVAVNAGGAVAAGVALWWTIRSSARRDPATVGWGRIRFPLGAALVLWGGVALVAQGALEFAWSNAYGMAFGAWTPPQVLFIMAVTAELAGALLLARARGAAAARWAVPLAGGLLLTFAAVAAGPYSLPNQQHGARFFLVSSAIYPLLLAWVARVPELRRTALLSAAIYTATVCVMVWLLPVFPARALVGPVFQKIDHMVPPRFPLLLVVPALVFDRVASASSARGGAKRGEWRRALLLALAFTAAFALVQWTFSAFLLSPASDNRFWAGGGRHWPFYADVGEERTRFWDSQDALDAGSAAACVVAAALSARAGLWLGRLTQRLQR